MRACTHHLHVIRSDAWGQASGRIILRTRTYAKRKRFVETRTLA